MKVTRKGWDHLISGSSGRRRNIRDKHSRLMLLKPAKHIIKTSKTVTTEKKNGQTFYVLEEVVRVGTQKRKVRVILKKDKVGNYTFYSVMKK